jgi:hypothetical protein
VAPWSHEERLDWIRQQRWIQSPRAKRILQRLVDYPPRHRMPCLAIYGSTGMGQTCILQKFLRDHRARFDQKLGSTRLPVVSIQMPPEPNLRDLDEEILAGRGGVFSPGTRVTTLRHRRRALAEPLEVRRWIMEEIQALLVGTPRQQRIILTAVRLLAKDLRIPLVCLGIEEANPALMTDDPWADRLAAAELPAWENDETFQQLRLSCASTLALRQPSDFRDAKVRQQMVSLTQGVLGRIGRLVETVALEAIGCGEERIPLALRKEELVTESLVCMADRQVRRLSA